MAAVALLGAGSAYAGFLYTTPVAARTSDLTTVRSLSQRLAATAQQEEVPLSAPAVLPVAPRPEAKPAAPAARRQPQAASTTETKKAETEAPKTPPAPPASPVQNIALMGVTHSDKENQAWLVDLSTQEREVVDEGGAAWGFTVKNIGDEQIVLAKGNDQFTIRLGEKTIPVNEAPAVETTPQQTANNGWGGWGGNGGGREARRAMFRQMMANGGGRNWSGGGNWNRGSWNGGSSNNSSSSNWRSRNNNSNRGGFSGGFNPGFGGFGGGYGGRRNQTQAAGPTSNPQTARRRGGQLVGGADPLPTPTPIANPQTQRRLGTTSGQAFGTGNQGPYGYGQTNRRNNR